MVRSRRYRDGKLAEEGFPIAAVSDYLTDPANTVWFDVCDPDEAALVSLRDELHLHLHHLAIEDVLQPGQRPKLDHYPEHLLVVAYSLFMDRERQRLVTHEVSVFITHNALVTVRADEGFDIDAVVGRWDETADLAS